VKEMQFNSAQVFNNNRVNFEPTASKNVMPKWFLRHGKYKKDEFGKEVFSEGEKMPSWKACPAVLDTLVSGYVLRTPCDILVTKQGGEYKIIPEKGFEKFVGLRGKELGFPTPPGYEDIHFYWYLNWMPQVPKGYTVLATQPINRFDLPFLTISGFIDCEEFGFPGKAPFFIKKGFEGFISSGTPYIQMIPFYQEDWKLKNNYYSEEELIARYNKQKENFISKIRTNYKEKFWIKKKYE